MIKTNIHRDYAPSRSSNDIWRSTEKIDIFGVLLLTVGGMEILHLKKPLSMSQ